MMTAQQALEQLRQARDNDSRDQLVARADSLSGPTRDAARSILCRVGALEGQDPGADVIADKLAALTADDLPTLFRCLHSGLGDDLLHWWQSPDVLPYLRSFSPRGFKAPHAPRLQLVSRVDDLCEVVRVAHPYNQDVAWFAAWGAHVYLPMGFGRIFATAVDNGNREVLTTLRDCVHGSHPVGGVTTAGLLALASTAHPEGWLLLQQLLVGFGRHEGLSHSVLNVIDLGRTETLQRALRIIEAESLTRFPATVSAVSGWLGEPFESQDASMIDRIVELAIRGLEDATARAAMAASADAREAAVGLWCMGIHDVAAAGDVAMSILSSRTGPDRRLAAARAVESFAVPGDESLCDFLTDEDPRVRAVAVRRLTRCPETTSAKRIAAIAKAVQAHPHRTPVDLGLWKKQPAAYRPDELATAAVQQVSGALLPAVSPLVTAMTADGRYVYAKAVKDAPATSWRREQLLSLLGDRSSKIRNAAVEGLRSSPSLSAEEMLEIEGLLKLKERRLRQGLVDLILQQSPDRVRRSIARLERGTLNQVAAAAELTQRSAAGQQPPLEPTTGTEAAAASAVTLPPSRDADVADVRRRAPSTHVEALLTRHTRTQARQPSAPATPGATMTDQDIDAVRRLVVSVGSFVGERATAAVPTDDPLDDSRLQDACWATIEDTLSDDRRELGIAVMALDWARYVAGGAATAVTAGTTRVAGPPAVAAWRRCGAGRLVELEDLATMSDLTTVHGLVKQMMHRSGTPEAVTAAVGVLTSYLAAVPAGDVAEDALRSGGLVPAWIDLLTDSLASTPTRWRQDDLGSLWQALRFIDEPTGEGLAHGRDGATVPRPARMRAPVQALLACHAAGIATDGDILDALLAPPVPGGGTGAGASRGTGDELMRELTRRPPGIDVRGSRVEELAQEAVDAVVADELQRGDAATATTGVARRILSLQGESLVLELLSQLGPAGLARQPRDSGKRSTFSHLVRVCVPGPDDSAESFAAEAAWRGVRQRALVELAVFAPQWAPFVEQALDWPGLTDGVQWLHAHGKGPQWQPGPEVMARWRAESSRRTPVDPDSLIAGAVDVGWFRRGLETMAADRIDALVRAAKYASSPDGHKRVKLYVGTLRGEVSAAELHARVVDRHDRDALRAYGLAALPPRSTAALAGACVRLAFVEDFLRGSHGFGPARQVSEGLAAQIATQNLASNAGLSDPRRLQWAREAAAGRCDAAPEERQQAGVSAALERAMVEGDGFPAGEFDALLAHPIVGPALRSLVVVTVEGLVGRPVGDGRFVGPDGMPVALDGSPRRVAHPDALAESREWESWRRWCSAEHVVQPFAQVDRALHGAGPEEGSGETVCRRYGGRVVKLGATLAALGQRGWCNADPVTAGMLGAGSPLVPASAVAVKTIHRLGVTAELAFDVRRDAAGQVDGHVLGDLVFRRTDGRLVPLEDVEVRAFSEVLRDIDLLLAQHASSR